MKIFTIRRNTPSKFGDPRSLVWMKEQRPIATWITFVSSLAYSSTLKMETTYSSETSFDFQRTTPHYMPKECIIHNHLYENLKSHKISSVTTPYKSQYKL
jgi:hypothetical protein